MSNLLVKNDIIFQLLFGQKKYEELLVSLLNAILNLPLEKRITGAVLDGNFRLDKCFVNDKIGILDIRAIASNQTRINIEIQLNNEYNMDKRTLFFSNCPSLENAYEITKVR